MPELEKPQPKSQQAKPPLPTPLKWANVDLIEEEYNQARQQLAEKAKTLFGYSKLQFHSPGKLAQAIHQAGINVLDKRSVVEYKRKMAQVKFRERIYPSFVIFFISLIGFVTLLPVAWHYMKPWPWVGDTVLLAVALVASLDAFPIPKVVKNWNWVSLRSYSDVIPEPYLQAAVDITERCPEASICIEYLIIEHRVHERHPDPFMRVDYLQERYYIGVWLEEEYQDWI